MSKASRKELLDMVEAGVWAQEQLKMIDEPMIIASRGAMFFRNFEYLRTNNKSVLYREKSTGRKMRVMGEYVDDRTNAFITAK